MKEAVQSYAGAKGQVQGRHPAGRFRAQLKAMAVEFPEVAGHPNRLPFEGCLTVVDVTSDKAPSGARGTACC